MNNKMNKIEEEIVREQTMKEEEEEAYKVCDVNQLRNYCVFSTEHASLEEEHNEKTQRRASSI